MPSRIYLHYLREEDRKARRFSLPSQWRESTVILMFLPDLLRWLEESREMPSENTKKHQAISRFRLFAISSIFVNSALEFFIATSCTLLPLLFITFFPKDENVRRFVFLLVEYMFTWFFTNNVSLQETGRCNLLEMLGNIG